LIQQLLDELPFRRSTVPPAARVFYLRSDDDVPSVLDRLDWVDAPRVILVLPPETSTFTKRLSLLRLIRYANQRRVGLALVAADPAQRTTAKDLQIPVFSTVERAQSARWRRRPRRAYAAPVPSKPVERTDPQSLRPRDSKVAAYILLGLTAGGFMTVTYDLATVSRIGLNLLLKDLALGIVAGAAFGLFVFLLAWSLQRYVPRLYRGLRAVLMMLVFALGMLSPIGAGYIIVPGARLTLTPAKIPVSAIARITVVVPGPEGSALDEIDFAGRRVPGRRVSAEVGAEATSAATGTSQVPSSRATGTVVFSNLLAQDYTVGRGTAVRTSAGTPVRFLTTGDVTVPPLGQAAVGIEAVEPGPQGNVGIGLTNQVEGAAARAVKVTNPEPTRGGGVSQVRAVTQSDRDALKRTILSELRSQGYQRILERPEAEGGLREGEYLIPGSVRVFQILHETYDRFATEEAESVRLEMRVSVTGVVADLGDAYNLARHVLAERVPDGYDLLDITFQPGLMGDNVLGDGTLTFFVETKGWAEARLRHDEVKQWLRGKRYTDGIGILDAAWRSDRLPVAERPQAEVWPEWADDRFPWLIWRIEVVEAETAEG
jgi:hypothetical protein